VDSPTFHMDAKVVNAGLLKLALQQFEEKDSWWNISRISQTILLCSPTSPPVTTKTSSMYTNTFPG
jgi:hypothetical protein